MLRKIAATEKFPNFDLFYLDFDFQESKCCLLLVMTADLSRAVFTGCPSRGVEVSREQTGQGLSPPPRPTK